MDKFKDANIQTIDTNGFFMVIPIIYKKTFVPVDVANETLSVSAVYSAFDAFNVHDGPDVMVKVLDLQKSLVSCCGDATKEKAARRHFIENMDYDVFRLGVLRCKLVAGRAEQERIQKETLVMQEKISGNKRRCDEIDDIMTLTRKRTLITMEEEQKERAKTAKFLPT
jgi:hypothetical protein